MTTPAQAIEILDQLQREIDVTNRPGTLGTAELCKAYKAAKPLLLALLPLIERLAGKTIADALRLLMRFADTVCPV
jgi:hypothetical protein